MPYKLLLILFLLLFSCTLNAAVFIVTSNADSGPGTLRQALTLAAANGNAEKDFINFNLPGTTETEHTILIKSGLPEINTDVVIDGSTQPGAPLAVNGAKIVISGFYKDDYDKVLFVFTLNSVASFELYGMIIKDIFLDPGNYAPYGGSTGLYIKGKNGHIIIGAPQKGNVMYNISNGIQCVGQNDALNTVHSETQSMEFKSNLFGIAEDGIRIGKFRQAGIYLPYVYTVVMGGDNKDEGNTIFNEIGIVPSNVGDDLNQDVHIKVKNNVFSANTLQQRTTDPDILTDRNQTGFSMGVDPLKPYHVNATIDVMDNVWGYTLYISGFTNLKLNIQSNFWGISADGKNQIPVGGEAITLAYIEGTSLIGGADLSKGNVFTNCVQDSRAVNFQEAVINVTEGSPEMNPKNLVELSHNSLYCNNNFPYVIQVAPDKKPIMVSVDNLTASGANGKTKPNARIELYYTDKDCTQCQPKTYIATTYADGTGNWAYNAPLLAGYGVMAGATLNKVSSEFTDTRIYATVSPIIIHPECDMGGSIQNALTVANAKKLQWENEEGKVFGTGLNLTNAPAGKYRLKAEQFGCIRYSNYFLLEDHTPVMYDNDLHVLQPACGNPGAITNLITGYAFKFKWLDAAGNKVSDQLDATNFNAGSYTLHYYGQRGCEKTYGPIVLKNSAGPAIDESDKKITFSQCGKLIGSVTNLAVTGSGTLHYSWRNEQDQEVGTLKDLNGQPEGKYVLHVTDDTGCGDVVSSAFEIKTLGGVELDEGIKKVKPATCGEANGSITNIVVGDGLGNSAPATFIYQWAEKSGVIAGNKKDLENVNGGDYQLTISNGCGASLKTTFINVAASNKTAYPEYSFKVTDICSGNNSGAITVQTDALVKQSRWVSAQGQDVPSSGISAVNNIPAGSYALYLTDKNDCENFYKNYTVQPFVALQIVQGSEQKSNDQCGANVGSIKGIQITGGKPPYTLNWVNVDGKRVSTTLDVVNIAAGSYTLSVMDAGSCNLSTTQTYTIQNDAVAVEPPIINALQVCTPGDALIKVNNALANTTYRLYTSPNGGMPIAEKTGGAFAVNVTPASTYYITQLNGLCESERVPVKISIGLSAINITNTFTPNGDGHNDYWKIDGVENSPQATVQVFNRNGQKLFESKGYTTPFNGTYNGKALPAGTYFYIIDLGKNCSLLSGSLTILR